MTARADTLLDTLQTPEVRDLAWACFSPPLIVSDAVAPAGLNLANCGLSLDGPRWHWLQQLDRRPQPLLQHLGTPAHRRLGLYFEALWHFFLAQDERVELLGHNLPVRESGQTIGEFDCLYYCRERRRHFHLELAVKFYLGLPQPGAVGTRSHWNRWLGPGSRDRLDLKLERLLQHQVQLGSHPKARKLLAELGIEQVELEMEIKGRLFNCTEQPLPPPFGYNSELDMCYWTATAQLKDHSDCAALDKRHWLTAVTPASKLSGVEPPLPDTGQPRLIATLDREGYELQRFFLVPEHWPDGS